MCYFNCFIKVIQENLCTHFQGFFSKTGLQISIFEIKLKKIVPILERSVYGAIFKKLTKKCQSQKPFY